MVLMLLMPVTKTNKNNWAKNKLAGNERLADTLCPDATNISIAKKSSSNFGAYSPIIFQFSYLKYDI